MREFKGAENVSRSPSWMVGDLARAPNLVTFDPGFIFADTEVGGLSAITYDAKRGVYYALSDDRSQIDPARYYEVAIDLADGSLDAGDVSFVDVTFLRNKKNSTFPPASLDPEGINLARPGQLFISSCLAILIVPAILFGVAFFLVPAFRSKCRSTLIQHSEKMEYQLYTFRKQTT